MDVLDLGFLRIPDFNTGYRFQDSDLGYIVRNLTILENLNQTHINDPVSIIFCEYFYITFWW